MDDLIDVFVKSHYTEELQEQIYVSLGLFTAFNKQEAFQEIPDILMMESYTETDDMSSQVLGIIIRELDDLIAHHTLALVDDTSIMQKNQILMGLYSLQHLEDYDPVIRALETLMTVEEKVVRVLSIVTELDESVLMSLVLSARESFVELLKKFIYNKEELQPEYVPTGVANISVNLKIFDEVFGKPSVVKYLVNTNILPSQEFSEYLTLFGTELIDHNSVLNTALTVFWLLLLSSDGTEKPLQTYRDNSQILFTDIKDITLVEQELVTAIGKFEEFKKVVNEKARLP